MDQPRQHPARTGRDRRRAAGRAHGAGDRRCGLADAGRRGAAAGASGVNGTALSAGAGLHWAPERGATPMNPIDVEFLESGKVMPPNLPFSEAVRVGRTLYLSGQMGIEPGSMRPVHGGIREQTRQTMENIKTTLEAHGASMRDIVKCTVMLADISDWTAFNEVYRTFFDE